MPSCVSLSPMRASGASTITRQSHCSASTQPPAMAWPLMAATIGRGAAKHAQHDVAEARDELPHRRPLQLDEQRQRQPRREVALVADEHGGARLGGLEAIDEPLDEVEHLLRHRVGLATLQPEDRYLFAHGRSVTSPWLGAAMHLAGTGGGAFPPDWCAGPRGRDRQGQARRGFGLGAPLARLALACCIEPTPTSSPRAPPQAGAATSAFSSATPRPFPTASSSSMRCAPSSTAA